MLSRRVFPAVLLSFAVFLIYAGAGIPDSWASSSPFRFDASVPEEQKNQLSTDLERLRDVSLAELGLKLPDGKDLLQDTVRMMGLGNLSSHELLQWISDRVQYLVGESFTLTAKNLYAPSQRGFVFENRSEMPTIETVASSGTPAPTAPGTVVMSNLGPAVYYAGKQQDMLMGLKVAGKKVPVTSPRSGILRVGPGLFMLKYMPNQTDASAVSNSIHRLGILFHEARHSDGHGKSLGFFHAICPSGNLQGLNACDRNLNGPYQVGARMTQILTENCRLQGACSVAETEKLRVQYLDSYSRTLLETSASKASAGSDSQFEIEMLKSKISTCELLLSLTHTEAAFCKEVDELRGKLAALEAAPAAMTSVPGLPSVEWDASPEGQRE
ncbi:MAG: hypothetical protein H7222_00795 [Methylotenera sp.]|nr:hypothetical protein [Oligoflexia bacterium]